VAKINLNPSQERVVRAPAGPMVVVAGAGSGKTRVITERVLALIRDRGVPPANILAVTFTNKAAQEMQRRLERALGYRPAVSVGTFHATGARILRAEAKYTAARADKNFVIFDQADTEAALKKIADAWTLPAEQFHYKRLAAAVEAAKRELITAADYPRYDGYREVIADVYAAYQEILRQNDAYDFGDLIMETALLFGREPDVLARWRDRFQHILVDEYQDTNFAQYEMLRLLAGKYRQICVVGDPDQSIYRWRGADAGNFKRFAENFPDAQVYTLEQNYRSHQGVLDAANALIKFNRQGRYAKDLWCDRPVEIRPAVIRCYDERHEALRVAYAIQEARANYGLDYREFAVLYRVNAQSRVFEEILAAAGVPFQIVGGTRFYERREVKEALAYLRLVHNPRDAVSFARIVNVPPRGVGAATLKVLEENRRGRPPLEAAGDEEVLRRLTSRAAAGLRRFTALINELALQAETRPPSEILAAAVEKSGYLSWLAESEVVKGEARAENVRELINAAAEFESEHAEATLAEFLEAVALVSDVDAYDADADRVSLMTLHTAKGLEFTGVFIVGLEEYLLPHANSMGETAELEEERRLCYVGMTRARDLLYLSYAETRSVAGVPQARAPSRFLLEIGESNYVEAEPVDVDDVVRYEPWGRRGGREDF
jgi:DNA helicase-2/ATP-dependent DNA helicase PcrA